MSRTLSPCGTEAAYRRHLRHGEEPCDDCKRAAALARGRRKGAEKAPPEQPKVIDLISREVILARPEDDDVSDLSPEDMRRELSALFLILKGALPKAMPREVASIAREMRNTLEMLQGMNASEGSSGPASFTDQLAQALAVVAQQESDRDDLDDEAEGVTDGDEDRSADSEDRGTA